VDDLVEVASCLEVYVGRHYLQLELARIFGGDRPANPVHHYLASTSAVQLIVTTNYDTLIEQAFLDQGREFHVVMTPIRAGQAEGALWWKPGAGDPRTCHYDELGRELRPEGTPIIYKIHGGLDLAGNWHGAVISEEDYFEIGGRTYDRSLLPIPVAAILSNSSILFLGYSLRDVHVRYMIDRFSRQIRHSHFLVSKYLSNLDRWRFSALGLRIEESTIDAFVERLQSTLL
jgi:hypothetical protein